MIAFFSLYRYIKNCYDLMMQGKKTKNGEQVV